MYGCCTPAVVYGVVEDDDVIIEDSFLDKYGVSCYATEVVRNTACKIVYGVGISLAEVKKGKTIRKVRMFARMLKKKYGIDLGHPEYHLCVYGDYDTNCHTPYNPEDMNDNKSDNKEE